MKYHMVVANSFQWKAVLDHSVCSKYISKQFRRGKWHCILHNQSTESPDAVGRQQFYRALELIGIYAEI